MKNKKHNKPIKIETQEEKLTRREALKRMAMTAGFVALQPMMKSLESTGLSSMEYQSYYDYGHYRYESYYDYGHYRYQSYYDYGHYRYQSYYDYGHYRYNSYGD